MRHSVHVMFGRVSEETLLGIKQYVLKYGSKEANEFFTALHIDETKTDLIIREAISEIPFGTDVLYSERFNTGYSEPILLKKNETEAIKDYLIRLRTSLVNADNPGDYPELHYCFYIPLFDEYAWPLAKLLIDIINTDVYSQPHVDIMGLCADMVTVFYDSKQLSYDKLIKKTNHTLSEIKAYIGKQTAIRHTILIDNKQSNGLALKLTKTTIIPLLGEFALLTVEKYKELFAGLLDKSKSFCAMGVASMGIDRFFFTEYLLRKTYLYAIEKEGISIEDVDVNKMSRLAQQILSKWTHLLSDLISQDVSQQQKLNVSDREIVEYISPIMREKLENLLDEVKEQLRDERLSIPEKKALVAVLMGRDDPSLVNLAFDDNPLILDDLEREAVNVFVDANNLLLAREDTKNGAILSQAMNADEPEDPVYYPLDDIKKNRSLIKHCVATIRSLQSQQERLIAQLEGHEVSQKCLIENGGVIYKGKTYRLLPQVDDPPLQEEYQPHPVTQDSIDIRAGFTQVKDQSSLGSCLPHALISVFEYFMKSNGEVVPDLSELFLYYNARARRNQVNEDSGSTLQDAMLSLTEQGICLEEFWPYDEAKFAEKPSDEAYVDAANRKVKTALNVSIETTDAIRSALSDGYPVLISIKVFESFTTGANGFIPLPKDDEKQSDKHGRHAMVLCGYSDKEKVFIARNSWGLDFGDKGYCYIPYSYITNPSLTNWAAVITEIVTARDVAGQQTQISNNRVFTIKVEQRAHVKFDQTDAHINLMVTQANLAQQQEILSKLIEEDNKYFLYYQVLKQKLKDENSNKTLEEASNHRFNLLIEETEKRCSDVEQEKFIELQKYDKTTLKQNIIRALIVLAIFIVGILIQVFVQDAQKVFLWILGGDVLLLLVCAVAWYFRRRERKRMEQDFDEKILRLGKEIGHFKKDQQLLKIKFFMAGTMLEKLFDLSDSLTIQYQKITSLRNNLQTWSKMLLAEDPNQSRASHPTSVFLLSSQVLDAFFEKEKDNITKDLHLSDFIDKFELSDDGLSKLKILVENAVRGKILDVLNDFSVYEYLSKGKEYPYLETIQSNQTMNVKLVELGRKAQVFLQFKTTSGGQNPQTNIYIHLEENEYNQWSTIYPQAFTICPNSIEIQSVDKILITNIVQLNLEDVLFYSDEK